MSENVEVKYCDLTSLNQTINATLGAIKTVSAQAAQVQNDVNVVNGKVVKVNQNLISLTVEFREWVKEQRNANNLQRALTEIVRIRQELDQKFGKHAEARTRLKGILDSAGTGLLRDFTVASCSEQVMLDTPKYWLSPCLVALAAWISNDKSLADKAVKVALDRDVEKSSLLFALVCRRTIPQGDHLTNEEKQVQQTRTDACFKWLDGYFKCQDPHAVSASVIVLIDSWKNEIFGKDEKDICKNTFESWMNQFKDELDSTEKAYWYSYFCHYCVSTADQVPVLSRVCPEFPAIDAYLQRIQSADAIQGYFDKILNAEVDKRDLVSRLDEQLDSLISDYDKEEVELRDEETSCMLTKKFNGDKEKVDRELAKIRVRRKPTDRVSFVKRLEEVVRSNDAKYVAARKTAIDKTFLGKYINGAYEDYITDQKQNFPQEINMQCKEWMGWKGKTKDGSNKEELNQSYTEHMEKLRQKDLDAVSNKKVKMNGFFGALFLVLAVILVALSQSAMNVVLCVISGIAGLFFLYRAFSANQQIKVTKNEIMKRYQEAIEAGLKLIAATLQQWQNVRSEVATFESKPSKATLRLSK